MYEELCNSVNEAYRKAKTENLDISIREFAAAIGEDFLVVWEILGYADWYAFYELPPPQLQKEIVCPLISPL